MVQFVIAIVFARDVLLQLRRLLKSYVGRRGSGLGLERLAQPVWPTMASTGLQTYYLVDASGRHECSRHHQLPPAEFVCPDN